MFEKISFPRHLNPESSRKKRRHGFVFQKQKIIITHYPYFTLNSHLFLFFSIMMFIKIVPSLHMIFSFQIYPLLLVHFDF